MTTMALPPGSRINRTDAAEYDLTFDGLKHEAMKQVANPNGLRKPHCGRLPRETHTLRAEACRPA